jgi:tetratricopeptide (TPR) repeat protein
MIKRAILTGAAAAVILLVTVVAYVPAMGAAFIWDDDDYIVENVHLRTSEGLGRIWFDVGATSQYYPLVFTTFWIEYHLWGDSPAGYHAINVLLHAVSAIVLWRILKRLSVPGAWLAAAIFALHPVHVESVAWITERKNVLSGLLYLTALLAYLHFDPRGTGRTPRPPRRPSRPPLPPPARPPRRRWRFWVLGVGLFAGALLSKTVTCSLPAAIALLIWWKRDRLAWRDVLPLLPLFALGAALALTTIWVERNVVGTEFITFDLSGLDRFLVAGRAFWFYAGKLLLPVELTFIYPRWAIDAAAWWQYLFPISAAGLALALWLLRRRIGKGPLVATLYFGGTLVPALGFVDVFPMVYSFVADHFQYLASIGPIVLFAALITQGLEKGAKHLNLDRLTVRGIAPAGLVTAALAAALLPVLGVLCWRQGRSYENLETLWRDTLHKNPTAVIAANNLANLLLRQDKLEESTDLLRRATQVDPAVVHPYMLARAHYNLGNNLGRKNQIGEAIAEYHTALETDPGYYNAYLGLGWAHERLGHLDEAIAHYRALLSRIPGHSAGQEALRRALETKQRTDP